MQVLITSLSKISYRKELHLVADERLTPSDKAGCWLVSAPKTALLKRQNLCETSLTVSTSLANAYFSIRTSVDNSQGGFAKSDRERSYRGRAP